MAKTAVADIIVPEVFENYTIERTAELSAFVQSGIMEADESFDDLAAGGGMVADMPFWKDLRNQGLGWVELVLGAVERPLLFRW